MKSAKEIRNEIKNKHFTLRELDAYMTKAGYHSNLEDADLDLIGKDEKAIYLGKEEDGKVEIKLLITRRSALPDAFGAIITNVHELQ